MKRIRILAAITTVIGIISLLAFILERMALTDIYHGEQDVRLEWGIVSFALLPLFLFHILALALAISSFGLLRPDGPRIMNPRS